LPEAAIQFSESSLTVLNICLAIIMFGVALDIRWVHFTQLVGQKKAIATGLFAQIILLPLLTLLLISVLPISPGMALGMLLVACCPGGNVSNFFSQLARGHVALSVTLTAFSSLGAFFITPLSFFPLGIYLAHTLNRNKIIRD
jgi:BASS family bile acid:Na+ symporter